MLKGPLCGPFFVKSGSYDKPLFSGILKAFLQVRIRPQTFQLEILQLVIGKGAAMTRIDLTVPFSQKDEAKSLGARWDPNLKTWYVPEGVEPGPFARWLPVPEDSTEGTCVS